MAMRAWNMAGLGGAALVLIVAACAPQNEVASTSVPDGRAIHRTTPLPASGPLPTGASIGAMSDQYARPRPGPVSAAGASAWVVPAPAPAFEISTPLPPADPPAPRPTAVANRQPASPAPAAPTPAPTRPQQATPAAAASVDLAKGRELFSQYGCGGCHALAEAGGSGGIGPSLDHNPRLTPDYVAGAIGEGRGAMPAFRDQMSASEIATLAAYVVQVSRK
jgi:mono/diheme cytochrome c family protein